MIREGLVGAAGVFWLVRGRRRGGAGTAAGRCRCRAGADLEVHVPSVIHFQGSRPVFRRWLTSWIGVPVVRKPRTSPLEFWGDVRGLLQAVNVRGGASITASHAASSADHGFLDQSAWRVSWAISSRFAARAAARSSSRSGLLRAGVAQRIAVTAVPALHTLRELLVPRAGDAEGAVDPESTAALARCGVEGLVAAEAHAFRAGLVEAGNSGVCAATSHAERFLGLHGSGVHQIRDVVPPAPNRGVGGGHRACDTGGQLVL